MEYAVAWVKKSVLAPFLRLWHKYRSSTVPFRDAMGEGGLIHEDP